MDTDDVFPYVSHLLSSAVKGTRSAVVPATEGSNEPDASKPSGEGLWQGLWQADKLW